jgi:hypothetical protein
MVDLSKCKKCNKQTSKEFCDFCFLDVIYKRLRKHIRTNRFIQKDDNLLIKDPLTKKILEFIINTPINVKYKGQLTSKTKEILTFCLDDIEEQYLNKLFHGKNFKLKFKKNQIPLFLVLTKEELQRLAKLHKVKLPKRKKTLVSEFLDHFEKQFPGTKFNIKKSIL